MESYRAWLEGTSRENGFAAISSARAYAHPEGEYDKQYRIQDGDLQSGLGMTSAVMEFDGVTTGPALEIGCGTGVASIGLVAAGCYPEVLLTDPSPAFLEITRAKIESLEAGRKSPVSYAILLGDELDRLPSGTFSLIALRSTLHHILDVNEFLRECARILQPGGVLAIQEPCAQGYLLMGALAAMLPKVAKRGGVILEKEEKQMLNKFANTMQKYHRRDLDKSKWEDKHLFELAELSNIAANLGMSSRYYVNEDYRELPMDAGDHRGKYDFYAFFRSYLQYCMSYPESLVEKLDQFAKPYFDYVTEASAGGSWPQVTAACFFRKEGPSSPAALATPQVEQSDDIKSGEALFRPSYHREDVFISEEHAQIFERTKDIPGWALQGDAFKQYELGYYSGDVILEIGTFGGRSAVCELLGALANPAREGTPFFYGVDIDGNFIRKAFNTLTAWNLSAYSRLFHGDLAGFFAKYPISPTIVFVHGDHLYEGVKADCQVLSRMLEPGVPVLFHDFLNPENDTGDYGVKKAAMEWAASGEARFVGASGCSGLFVKVTPRQVPA